MIGKWQRRRGADQAHRDAAEEQHDCTTPDLEALAEKVVSLVLVKLAKLAGKAAEPSIYSSRTGCGPAGVPDREWKAIAKKLGRKPYPAARWFVVDLDAYEAWLAAQSKPATAPVAANDAQPWSARGALASVGLRGTR